MYWPFAALWCNLEQKLKLTWNWNLLLWQWHADWRISTRTEFPLWQITDSLTFFHHLNLSKAAVHFFVAYLFACLFVCFHLTLSFWWKVKATENGMNIIGQWQQIHWRCERWATKLSSNVQSSSGQARCLEDGQMITSHYLHPYFDHKIRFYKQFKDENIFYIKCPGPAVPSQTTSNHESVTECFVLSYLTLASALRLAGS